MKALLVGLSLLMGVSLFAQNYNYGDPYANWLRNWELDLEIRHKIEEQRLFDSTDHKFQPIIIFMNEPLFNPHPLFFNNNCCKPCSPYIDFIH